MRIAVYLPSNIPESFRVYYENLSPCLKNMVELIEFSDPSICPPDCSLIWDIRSGGGHPPIESLLNHSVPMVVTVHGVAPLAIPLKDYCTGLRETYTVMVTNRAKRKAWKKLILSSRLPTIIAVSEYGKHSIQEQLGVPGGAIHVCHHGVNHELYNNKKSDEMESYFLHISNGEKRKNIARIIAAHKSVDRYTTKKLILKVPQHIKEKFGPIEGVQYITERLSDKEISGLYKGAYAYIFPSLYEGFGLPVLESMASGTPVITGKTSACSEIGGKAAIVVDPKSVSEIAGAMVKLMRDQSYYTEHCSLSLQQASTFSWSKSAEQHVEVFAHAVEQCH